MQLFLKMEKSPSSKSDFLPVLYYFKRLFVKELPLLLEYEILIVLHCLQDLLWKVLETIMVTISKNGIWDMSFPKYD